MLKRGFQTIIYTFSEVTFEAPVWSCAPSSALVVASLFLKFIYPCADYVIDLHDLQQK